jgi:tetratricopeptide (TPR) repeat protein
LRNKNLDSSFLLIEETNNLISKKYDVKSNTLLNFFKKQNKVFLKDHKNQFYLKKLGEYFHLKAVLFNLKGQFSKSLEFNLKAVRVWNLLEKNINKYSQFEIDKFKSSSYGNIGIIYEELGEFDNAIQYYNRCLFIKKKIKDEKGIAIVLGSLGTVNYYKGNFDEAKKYFNKAYQLFLKQNDLYNASSFLGNIALLNYEEKNYDLAIKLFLKGIELDRKIDKKIGISSKLGNIALIYIDKKEFKTAEKYLQEALEISKKNKLTFVQLDQHKFFSTLYEKSNEPKKALFHYKKFQELKDSLKNDDVIKEKTLLEAEFEFEKKQDKLIAQQEKKDALTKLEKKKQKMVILLLILLFLVTTFTSIVLFLFYKRRKKEQEILNAKKQLEIEYKLLRTQMNPHFIFNVLNSIHNYINQESNEKASYLLVKFSKLIRNILQHSTKEEITLEEEIKQLELYILIEESRFSNSFKHKFYISEKIKQDEILIPPMILQPFVENAIIHGLAPLKSILGELIIEIGLHNKKMLEVNICDNGVGMSKTSSKNENHESLSIKLIQERLEILNKSSENLIDFINLEQGTKVRILIPFENNF